MELLFILLVAFFGFALTWLTASGKIVRGAKHRWINNKGWQVLVCGSLTMILLVAQFIYSSSKEEKIRTQALKSQIERDSLNHFEITKALLEYNLKYDSSQQVITKLIQDSLRNTTIISAVEPTIHFCENGFNVTEHTISRIKVEFAVCAFDAASEDVSVKIAFVLKDEKIGNYHGKTSFRSLCKNDAFTVGAKIDASQIFHRPKRTDLVLANLKGSYASKSGKIYTINLFIGYNLNTGKVGVPSEDEYNRLVEIFK